MKIVLDTNYRQPLLDIDVEGESDQAESSSAAKIESSAKDPSSTAEAEEPQRTEQTTDISHASSHTSCSSTTATSTFLASPAVRRILKENNLALSNVQGSGKDGRVLKEDVQRHIDNQSNAAIPMEPAPATGLTTEDQRVTLTPIQKEMFQSMTQSLEIPHFLYSHKVDLTSLTELRKRLSKDRSAKSIKEKGTGESPKLTLLPFALKALSQAFKAYPNMNSILQSVDGDDQPQLIRKHHTTLELPSTLVKVYYY